MRTVRQNVFETNSSSMHTLTIMSERRTPNEFPPLSEDGCLDIEVTRYWHSAKTCHTENLRDIIEYICVLAEASNNDHDGALQLLRERYTAAGLTPPEDFRLYVVDIDGNRVDYNSDYVFPVDQWSSDTGTFKPVFCIYVNDDTDENAQDINAYLTTNFGTGPYSTPYVEMNLEQFMVFRQIFPNHRLTSCNYTPIGEQPVLNHPVGVAANCLIDDSLAEALECLYNPELDTNCDIEDAFIYISKLGFYHS